MSAPRTPGPGALSPQASPELADELTRIAWRVDRWIDPGPASVVAGAGVAAVVAALLMPWSTRGAGWEVLVGRAAMGPLPWLFTVVAVVAVGASVLALLTRFWPLAWTAATVTGVGAVTGLWAVWSRQTAVAGTDDIGPGLIVTVLGVLVLFGTWARTVVACGPRAPHGPPA
ncbi:hypothetical protein ACFU8R_27555 [Pseudonocardia alni]|jgi:hypothetical protein|uniref:Uncharacterized protein n=1 Tax=Pseudonocardia alni TaxID=33907 RepID=A0A852WDS7_PSEA5|nr:MULTISPECIES: hypothetical protein [Pseudonocardia]MCO7194244.1 hypothetical protein [Pseudonocardia sp. McavD-2-B]NYG04435.1 hypothetical protein [Pseudonocardia antarctica]PKB30065.1 hypothetical protein ATL51_1715 [Pseudonocardia alni]